MPSTSSNDRTFTWTMNEPLGATTFILSIPTARYR